MNSATAVPAQKVIATTIAGAITAILIWLLSAFGHIDIPAGIDVAFSTLIGAVVGYYTKPAAKDAPVPASAKVTA